ncbi:MAG: VaFE repeat-containing surface-anchored protein, partial [Methanobrevibacter sp.]|nr:VaFE repeat-containing surface-anchored protein [Methanobrevibacter sp.]
TENNAVMTAVSDENGVFEFNKIPYGQYIVHELQSADGFMPNREKYPVTIAENDCIIEIKVVNDRIPEIKTTATADGKKEIGASDTFILEDEVAYEHLIPNKEYTLKGIVMDKATNQPMIINGRKIAVEKVFVPETPSGRITVRFRIHATEIKKQTDLVVFETLYDDGQEIARVFE